MTDNDKDMASPSGTALSSSTGPDVPALRASIADAGEIRVAIQRALQATLGDTYDCTRVWSAWGYGTMGEDDFVPVLDRMDEIIDEVAARLADVVPVFGSDPDLLTAAQAMLPSNISLGNPAWPDSRVVPIDFTLGELRALHAAIQRATGGAA